MSAPQVVTKKPIEAAKFEGGLEEATVIIAWVGSHGHIGIWWPAEEATPEDSEGKGSPGSPERIEIQGHGVYYVGDWIVYDGIYYQGFDEKDFARLYDLPKEPLKTFVERHLGEDAEHTYWPRPVAAKALQMPIQKEHEAAKDLEERVRAIAQFIDAEGGIVYDFNVKELGFSYGDDALRLEPGEWVVSDFNNDLHVFSHEYFRLFYMTAEEADRNG